LRANQRKDNQHTYVTNNSKLRKIVEAVVLEEPRQCVDAVGVCFKLTCKPYATRNFLICEIFGDEFR
jgi:hypothetical protein